MQCHGGVTTTVTLSSTLPPPPGVRDPGYLSTDLSLGYLTTDTGDVEVRQIYHPLGVSTAGAPPSPLFPLPLASQHCKIEEAD